MRRSTVVVLLVLTAALTLGGGTAVAAPCPEVMPISEVADAASAPGGLAANGLTVSRGIDPEPFEVTVLGVLQGAIAPGVDMIIVEVDSPAIDRAGGIWAGMSGSPVYADADGRLIGAVAYGLSFGPSKIGGLAAAEDMSRLVDLPESAQQGAVQLSRSLQQEVAATGSASASEAAAGLERLPLPLGVSGLSAGRLQALGGRLGAGGRFIPYGTGAAAAAPGDPAEIVPGGNFAAALSYGDLSTAGVGTTTAVCGERAIAFGHPMIFAGPTALSAHTASAITIQDDPAFVPFKIANVGGVVGTLDQDRLAGIRALLGDGPTAIEVRSTVTDAGGSARDGLTSVNRTLDVPFVAGLHLLSNIDRVIDRIGSGRAHVGWTVTGTAGGEHFSLSRNNRFADPGDIAIASIGELLEQLATLADNPFVPIAFTGVSIDAALDPAFQRYRITGLERHDGAGWVRVDPNQLLVVAPDTTLLVRVLLAAHRSDAAVAPLEMSFAIPAEAAGSDGSLDVTGGPGSSEGEFEGEFAPAGELPGPDGSAESEPKSFQELLASLQDAPRGDEVLTQLQLFGSSPTAAPPPAASVRRRVAEVVDGGLSIAVSVPGGELPPEFPPFEEPPFEEPGGAGLGLRGRSSLPLSTALRRGIRLTVRTSEAGRLVLRALASRKAARRLGLEKRVVGSLARIVTAGRTRLRVKLDRAAKERLRGASRVRLTIRATLRTLDGSSRKDRFSVALRRRAG